MLQKSAPESRHRIQYDYAIKKQQGSHWFRSICIKQVVRLYGRTSNYDYPTTPSTVLSLPLLSTSSSIFVCWLSKHTLFTLDYPNRSPLHTPRYGYLHLSRFFRTTQQCQFVWGACDKSLRILRALRRFFICIRGRRSDSGRLRSAQQFGWTDMVLRNQLANARAPSPLFEGENAFVEIRVVGPVLTLIYLIE